MRVSWDSLGIECGILGFQVGQVCFLGLWKRGV